MNPELKAFDKILFLEFRPWLMRGTPDAKFKEMHLSLAGVLPSFPLSYKVEFFQPLTDKRAYYTALISGGSVQYLNSIYNEVSSVTNVSEFPYWSSTLLGKTLPTKFQEIERAISDNEAQLEKLSKTLNAKGIDKEHQDTIFILQNLKHHAIWIFLEVQELLKGHTTETLTQELIHLKYFSEPQSDIELICQSKPRTEAEPGLIEKMPDFAFEPKLYDFRHPNKGVLSFDALVKNPTRFANFERLMHANGLITDQYNLIQQKGILTLFAAIYRLLISKGYFNQRLFPGRKLINPILIRKFLDYRYALNTEQQFRTYNNKPELWIAITEKYAWLENLPPS